MQTDTAPFSIVHNYILEIKPPLPDYYIAGIDNGSRRFAREFVASNGWCGLYFVSCKKKGASLLQSLSERVQPLLTC